MNVLGFAYQVIEMQERINQLEREKTDLLWFKQEYHNLMDSSIKHNRTMMENIIKICVTPGVIEACKQERTFMNIED